MIYLVPKTKYHSKWDNKLPPVIRVNPGDIVRIETNDTLGGQINPGSTGEDMAKVDTSVIHPITGPIFINGANPGDTLVVEILKIDTADWGYTAIVPGQGFLPEDFGKPAITIWKISEDRSFIHSDSLPGVNVSLKPFCGIMGVAPKAAGVFPTLPPGYHGGNIDIKYLTEGSTLYLPIFNEGALFSVGDVHMAQGDGEVCISAAETDATVTLRFGLRQGQLFDEPYFETPTHFSTTGFATNLDEACKKALRNLIRCFEVEKKMKKESAYILASVAADLKVFEVVNAPNVLAGAMISKAIFLKDNSNL